MKVVRNESVFTWAAPPLKFGDGALDEVADEVAATGAQTCLVITDRGVRDTGIPDRVADQLRAAGIRAEIFDQVAVEPTDESIELAVAFRARAVVRLLRGDRGRLGNRHCQGCEPSDHSPR